MAATLPWSPWNALERRDIRLWHKCTSWIIGSPFFSLEAVSFPHSSPSGGPSHRSRRSGSVRRCRVPSGWRSLRRPSASARRRSGRWTFITDHPMIPREHLALWLGVSEGWVSQIMHSLVDTWGLVERRGKRGDTRCTLSAEGIRYATHRDRAELPTTRGIWSTALTTDLQGRRRHVGHRIDTWARQTKHADGITWFLSKLEAEARADPDSELQWSVPTARSDRAYNWGDSAIAPDAVGKVIAGGLHVPFYFEYELRARHPREVIARLSPYESYYWFNEPREDRPPVPHYALRCGHRGGRGHLRAHRCPHEPDVPAHLRVLRTPFCPAQGYWDGPGVRSGRLSPPDCPCPRCLPTSGTHSTTGCVTFL